MKVLVLNCGSSSVKFQLIDTSAELMASNSDRCIAKGVVERIGTDESAFEITVPPQPTQKQMVEILDHQEALSQAIAALKESRVLAEVSQIQAVGHRVVHGGEQFARSMVIDEEVERQIQRCSELAPLHNPNNLKGYQVARKIMPQVPQVAVFDTAFHQTLPPEAHIYGLPYAYYRHYQVRRYGFHGTSHRYVAQRYRQIFEKQKGEVNLITAHLGNGCSITAIEKGKSVDTSMGFTPLEGLLMGTRSGDLDPAVILYLMSREDLTIHDMSTLLNKFSGLFGIAGDSDMRELIASDEKGDKSARLGIDAFCYRLRKYIGAYTAVLGQVHGLVFTGGIGENAAVVREKACQGLAELGYAIDPSRNRQIAGSEGEISMDASRARIMVIPTNEELLIARDTFCAVRGIPFPD
jgi:acetate kinase